MSIRWDPDKSAWLKRTRGVSFEDILNARYIGVQKNPKRPNQSLMLFELDDYIWAVPYVRDINGIFLKTLFPSRVFTKKWVSGELS